MSGGHKLEISTGGSFHVKRLTGPARDNDWSSGLCLISGIGDPDGLGLGHLRLPEEEHGYDEAKGGKECKLVGMGDHLHVGRKRLDREG